MKIRTGDSVVIITGKDKGKTGTVLKVLPFKARVVVAGVNMRTKHIKKTSQRPGQRIQFEGSIAVSNVMLVDHKTKKRSRVGFVIDEQGKKKRVTKRSGEAIVRAKSEAKDAGSKGTRVKTVKKEDTAAAPPTEGKKTARQPFWKKLGFGAEAMEEVAEVSGEPHGKEDHSVSKDSQSSSRRAYQRGS